MKLRLQTPEARTSQRAEGRFSGTRACQITTEFSLPAEIPDLQITHARLALAFHGSAFQCTATITRDGKRQVLTGGPWYEIAQPAKWYDPERRALTISVNIEPTGINTEAAVAAVNYWQIRELDLEIGGTLP